MKQISIVIMISMVVIVQLYDLHYVIKQKHVAMDEGQNNISILQDDILSLVGETHSAVLFENWDNWSDVYKVRSLAVWAFKNEMYTYFSVANSGLYENSARLGEDRLLKIKSQGNIGDAVVISTDEETMRWYIENLNAAVYECYDMYFIYIPK